MGASRLGSDNPLGDSALDGVITWDATGVAATVPVGTTAQVLTSNGTGAAPTFQAPAITSVNSEFGVATQAGATQVISHGLGVAPSKIRFSAMDGSENSDGGYDGTNNNCVYKIGGGGSTTSTTRSMFIDFGSGNISEGHVSATSSTNFTITWTTAGTAPVTDFSWEATA